MKKEFTKELVKTALIGTKRAEVPRVVLDELEKKKMTSSFKEEQVLSAAALLNMTEKAGFQTKHISTIPESPKYQTETTTCSPASIKHLYMVVDGAFELALPEFLHHLGLNKKCLPPEILPDLLEQSLASQDLWQKLQKSIGDRGWWLIQQNPDWFPLLPKQEKPWDDASNEERLSIWEKQWLDQPYDALNLLEETWSSESNNQRLAFLKVLEKNLSPDAEIFLESLLDDRRKEIRKSAVRMLAQIPDSQFSKRTFKRLSELMEIKTSKSKGDLLQVQLPDQLDDEMIRDGIDPRVQWFKGGVKASRLGQMVAMIHPKLWEEQFKKDAAEIVNLFRSSDWGELLLQAVIEAAVLHKDENWTAALLLFKIENQHIQQWQNLNTNRLIEQVSDKIFNTVATKGMEQNQGLLEEGSPVTYMLKNCACLWSDELTELVIVNLHEWLAGESSRYWNGWHYRSILKKASYMCNPFIHEKFSYEWWPRESKIWGSWEREVDDFLATLHFRCKMVEGLKS
ncbi:MAG: DUF5691 domain-containing protein [Saprospiraceae bacterium]